MKTKKFIAAGVLAASLLGYNLVTKQKKKHKKL